jgi:hypothetical protein
VGEAVSDNPQNATPKKPPRWVKGFLAALSTTGNVSAACEASHIDRTTAYRLRDDDKGFAAAWASALDEAADLLEEEARRRAYQGVQRLKFDRGRLITIPLIGADGKPVKDAETGEIVMVPYVEHEYSDTLLIFLLKGARPDVYRERTDVRHSGKIDVSKLSDAELQSIIENAG